MRGCLPSYLCILFGIAAVLPILGDDLPRHGVVGLTVAATNPSRPEDPETNPPTVTAVAPGSAAETADIRVGDVLRGLDGTRVQSPADFAARVARHLAGDRVTVLVVRSGREIATSVTLKARPYETSPDAKVLYTSVTAGGARRRVIVTQPTTTGRHPALLLIGGLGCYSLDGELMRTSGYGPILAALVKKGFATVRVEKTGEGDSEGPACTDSKATAELEADGYLAALRLVKRYEFVDPERVFILAHSLGPLLGSKVAAQEPVRGFVATETIGRSWFEYGLENVRRQNAVLGEPPDQVDADVRAHAQCATHFYILHEPADAVSRLGATCAEMIQSYAGMPDTYMHQIGDLSIAAQWKQADIPVLVIYGTADPVTSAEEGRYLVELINQFHPGRATYAEIPGMSHDFGLYSSQAAFLKRRGDEREHPFATEVVAVMLKWLDQAM